jgi:hypothetical protein
MILDILTTFINRNAVAFSVPRITIVAIAFLSATSLFDRTVGSVLLVDSLTNVVARTSAGVKFIRL